MTLLVALDYRQVSVSGSEQIMGEGKDENAFRYFVSKLVSSAGYRRSKKVTHAVAPKGRFCIHLARDPGDIGGAFTGRQWIFARKQEADTIHFGNL
jgi:hypothetical protein